MCWKKHWSIKIKNIWKNFEDELWKYFCKAWDLHTEFWFVYIIMLFYENVLIVKQALFI